MYISCLVFTIFCLKVQRGDEGTKIDVNRRLTNLHHGKDGLSNETNIRQETKDSRRDKVYTNQSEGSEEEDEATPEVWIPPTISKNKSAIADKISESPSKQIDRFNPLRKPDNSLAVHRSEPDTLEKGTLNPIKLQILKEKGTGDGTSIDQLQSKFETKLLKSPLKVEIEGVGKSSEISAHNREMQLNSRIHQNIKEVIYKHNVFIDLLLNISILNFFLSLWKTKAITKTIILMFHCGYDGIK